MRKFKIPSPPSSTTKSVRFPNDVIGGGGGGHPGNGLHLQCLCGGGGGAGGAGKFTGRRLNLIQRDLIQRGVTMKNVKYGKCVRCGKTYEATRT